MLQRLQKKQAEEEALASKLKQEAELFQKQMELISQRKDTERKRAELEMEMKMKEQSEKDRSMS